MHFWAVSIVLFTPTIDGSTFLKSSSTCLLLLHLCRDRGKGVVGNCREACVGMKGAGIGRQAAVGQAVVGQALEAKGRDGVVGQGGGSHCPMGVSTRPAWHSEFYAWLFLLWPRLIQNSCWINLKGGAFWENLSSVVTSLDSWKTNWEIKKEPFYWLSEVLLWILWPQLKYWFQSRHF